MELDSKTVLKMGIGDLNQYADTLLGILNAQNRVYAETKQFRDDAGICTFTPQGPKIPRSFYEMNPELLHTRSICPCRTIDECVAFFSSPTIGDL